VRRRGRKILESKFKLIFKFVLAFITLFSHTHRDSPSLANNSTQWWPPRSTTPPLPSTILSFPFSGSTLLYLYSPLTHIFNNFTFSSIFSFQVNQKIPRRFHAQSHQVTLRLHLQIQGQPPLPKWFQISQDLVPICKLHFYLNHHYHFPTTLFSSLYTCTLTFNNYSLFYHITQLLLG
jgi:hypothetical protein